MKKLLLAFILIFTLFSAPVQAEHEKECAVEADFVLNVASLRDRGVEKDKLIASYHKIEGVHPKVLAWMVAVTRIIYKNADLNELELAQSYYYECAVHEEEA